MGLCVRILKSSWVEFLKHDPNDRMEEHSRHCHRPAMGAGHDLRRRSVVDWGEFWRAVSVCWRRGSGTAKCSVGTVVDAEVAWLGCSWSRRHDVWRVAQADFHDRRHCAGSSKAQARTVVVGDADRSGGCAEGAMAGALGHPSILTD